MGRFGDGLNRYGPWALLLILSLILFSCAANGAGEISEVTGKCSRALEDPKLDAVRDKIVLGSYSPTILMLSSEERPSAGELEALRHYFHIRERCSPQVAALADKYEPAYSPFLRKSIFQVDEVLADLYRGNITYGDANRLIGQILRERDEGYRHALGVQAELDIQRRRELIGRGLELMSPPQSTGGSSRDLCRFNPATGSYQECLHVGANGSCFHFGAPC